MISSMYKVKHCKENYSEKTKTISGRINEAHILRIFLDIY